MRSVLPAPSGRTCCTVIGDGSGSRDQFSKSFEESFLRVLKSAFDLIVIDSAPVLAVADSLAIARHADAVVLVTRWSAPLQVVMKAMEEIHRGVAGMSRG